LTYPIHPYAAIEKILATKVDGPNNTKECKVGGAELKPFLNNLFTGLFSIVDNTELNENEYVMKCIMRALSVARDDLMDVVQVVLEKLTAALAQVAKNPKNPQYNHFLFESIAVLILAVCTTDATLTAAFEHFLFPPFQTVVPSIADTDALGAKGQYPSFVSLVDSVFEQGSQ